jgi:hypothetical protein
LVVVAAVATVAVAEPEKLGLDLIWQYQPPAILL